MTATNWFLLVLTAVLFGSSFPLINIAVDEISPMYMAAARVLIATPIVVVFLYASGRKLPPIGIKWLPLLVLGLLTAAIPYFTIAWGQTRIDSSLGGILFATIPIFTVILAPILTKEASLSGARMMGVALAFLGVVLAVGPESFENLGGQAAGAVVTLAAALSYALGNIFARAQSELDPVLMAAGQMVTASLVLVPIGLFSGGPFPAMPNAAAIFATLAVGVFSTAVPVLLMFMLVKKVGATRTSLLAFFIPVAAVLLGVALLGEQLAPLTILGFAMIIGGALWSSRVPAKAPEPVATSQSASIRD